MAQAAKTSTSPRLRQQYDAEIASALKAELKIDNPHMIPKLEKIVVSIGLGRGKDDKKLFEIATNTLRKITGQEPVVTIARKSIASFKLREGNPVGLKVTLRGARMYEFADRLINIVLPRLRDFHGVPETSFDATGNYSLGLREQSVFPELEFDEITVPHGIEVTFVTTTSDKEQSKALLAAFGMPFQKGKER